MIELFEHFLGSSYKDHSDHDMKDSFLEIVPHG